MAVELTITDFLRGVATGRQPRPHPAAILGGRGFPTRGGEATGKMITGLRIERVAATVKSLRHWPARHSVPHPRPIRGR
jgi:hypothetical protein